MKVKVAFSVSLDGFGAGPRQSDQDPLGVGGRQLHDWRFAAPTATDEAVAAKSFDNIGAWILGFPPTRKSCARMERAARQARGTGLSASA